MRAAHRSLRILLRLLAVLGVLAVLAAAGGWLLLRGSLATLDGARTVAGLTAPAVIERDADGVPTIRAGNREDAARALGFLHAQERFFQMDLLRRQSAGELSELFGPAALGMDRQSRQHLFRRRATGVLQALPADKLRQVEAYTAGVNAGLAALGARPWEYLVLRARPRPWRREDCILVADTMVMTLETDGSDERTRAAILETYGDDALAFLRPLVTSRAAALDGSTAPAPPVPDAAHLTARPLPPGAAAPVPLLSALDVKPADADGEELPGSNSFALAGARAAGGAALVANDPHLALAVPNIWFRVSLALPGRSVTGVTLPGVPGIIIGSNGDIAWAFTNGYTDTCDLVVVETDPADPTRYRVPDGNGWEPFETTRETIPVHGGANETCAVMTTRWGPLITRPGTGGPVYARHWSEYDPQGVNFEIFDLSDARSVEEAVAVAHRCGMHPQNLIVGDRTGALAWTIIGQTPRRVGFDGTTPQSWADGSRRWNGFVPSADVPVIRDPTDGQLWSANNRAVGGPALAVLGEGGYADPSRAAQIRDRLTALNGRPAVPADLLAIQLDDESFYLFRWRELLLHVLSDEVVEDQPALDDLREAVRGWNGHAAADAAGHWLVREFRRIVTTMVLNPIYEPVRQREPLAGPGQQAEQPLWSILDARPAHLLPAACSSWDELLLRAARMTAKLGEHQPDGPALADCAWGKHNVLAMKHPLSRALPARVAAWIDMPAREMPGDSNMPRVQMPSFGASMRMVVAPGREGEGIFHQPGGASGHPLSPFYRAGHEDWVNGRATPFLPGPTKYRLELQPKRS